MSNEHDPDEFRSSMGSLKTFIESSVWKDMRAFLESRLELITDDLILETKPDKIGRLQGKAEAYKTFLSLPEGMLHEMELVENEHGKESKNG